jgi:hypothetical protein
MGSFRSHSNNLTNSEIQDDNKHLNSNSSIINNKHLKIGANNY